MGGRVAVRGFFAFIINYSVLRIIAPNLPAPGFSPWGTPPESRVVKSLGCAFFELWL